MAEQPGDRVDPRPAGDVEQDPGVVERALLGEHRRHVLGPAGQGQGQRPGRRLGLHRRLDPFLIDEGGPGLVAGRARRAVGDQPLDHLDHAGRVAGQADVAADVEVGAGGQVVAGQLGQADLPLLVVEQEPEGPERP